MDLVMFLLYGGQVIVISNVLMVWLCDVGYNFDFVDVWCVGVMLWQVVGDMLCVGVFFCFFMQVELVFYWLEVIVFDGVIEVVIVLLIMMVDVMVVGEVDVFCVGELWVLFVVECGIGVLLLFGCVIWVVLLEKGLVLWCDFILVCVEQIGWLMCVVWWVG